MRSQMRTLFIGSLLAFSLSALASPLTMLATPAMRLKYPPDTFRRHPLHHPR